MCSLKCVRRCIMSVLMQFTYLFIVTSAAVECIYDMVICPYTNVCVFADSFCNGVNDCGDNADEDTDICGQPLYLYHNINNDHRRHRYQLNGFGL